ncbi:MAG TPA: alpha/beta hydrolase [Pseudomonadales bacterium]|jgi:proline iminopeptidase|nr:alpha/beta hydrolase [Pseudomonadales bacterium]
MRIEVNGARIFFDVEGAKLVPEGTTMREKPTLLLLHGGPGFDHSGFKPEFSSFADIAQVIYLDHHGNGRSDREPHERWNLPQWGDDIAEFCRLLEIDKPIVLGQSFGGMVAMSYATRHPEHPGKLILSSTAANMQRRMERSIAKFTERGGETIGEMARRLYNGAIDDPDFAEQWLTQAMPVYNTRPARDPDAAARAVMGFDVLKHFFRRAGEIWAFDMLDDLSRVRCPTLVLGGEEDPITPIECQEDIAAAIPSELVSYQRFPGAGHGVFRDDAAAFDTIRAFILS